MVPKTNPTSTVNRVLNNMMNLIPNSTRNTTTHSMRICRMKMLNFHNNIISKPSNRQLFSATPNDSSKRELQPSTLMIRTFINSMSNSQIYFIKLLLKMQIIIETPAGLLIFKHDTCQKILNKSPDFSFTSGEVKDISFPFSESIFLLVLSKIFLKLGCNQNLTFQFH